MSKYNSPNDKQWQHFLLREKGLPFDPEQMEGWQRVFHHNLTLGANNIIDEDDPVDEEQIADKRTTSVEEYDVTANNYFGISLPREAVDVEDKAELCSHLADVIEKYDIQNVSAITLEETHDYARDGYYPYFIVWRYSKREN
jgi:hypothetical protein